MTSPPAMTDRAALERNRTRARGRGPALFLHEEVACEIEERLAEVNRVFTDTAVVTAFPETWSPRLPAALTVADAEVLDLAPGSCDLVISALCLHWANDPVGHLVQLRRALRPDGLMIAALFGGRTLSELRACLAEAEASVTGGLSPRVAPMGEIRDLGGLLQRAGFALPVADSAMKTVLYRDLGHLAADLRDMGEGNALAARMRRPGRRAVFEEAARLYGATFPAPPDRIRASFELTFLTGWAPGPGQPKALRPGSAATRLADALGGEEQALRDDGQD